MLTPPLLAGAAQLRETWPVPALAARPVGAPGGVPAMGEDVIRTVDGAVVTGDELCMDGGVAVEGPGEVCVLLGVCDGRVAGGRRAGGGGRERGGALDPEVLERVAEPTLVGGRHGERRKTYVVVRVDDTRVDVLHRALHRRQHVVRRVGDVAHVALLHIGRRGDDDGRHAVGVADVVRAVVAVLGIVLRHHDERVVLVGGVVHDRVDDLLRDGVVLRDVLERAGMVVEKLDVGVGRQAVRRYEVVVVGGGGLVVVVLAAAGVVVVVELLRDARAGPVDRQGLNGPGGRGGPVPAAGVAAQHPHAGGPVP